MVAGPRLTTEFVMPAPSPASPLPVLWRETFRRADALPGFDRRRGHRVPDSVSSGATAFVRRLAAEEVKQEIEACHAALRTKLGYKRRQLRVTVQAEGASIITPDFEFHLVVEQDPGDPGGACLRRTIQGVRTRAILASPAFAQAFGSGFDGLDLTVGQHIDVAGLIDAIETREPPGWTLDYGYEAKSLTLTSPQLPLAVHVTPARVRLVGERPQGAPLLLEAADAAVSAMGGHEALRTEPGRFRRNS